MRMRFGKKCRVVFTLRMVVSLIILLILTSRFLVVRTVALTARVLKIVLSALLFLVRKLRFRVTSWVLMFLFRGLVSVLIRIGRRVIVLGMFTTTRLVVLLFVTRGRAFVLFVLLVMVDRLTRILVTRVEEVCTDATCSTVLDSDVISSDGKS